MRPHLSILLLIALSYFLHFTHADSQAAKETDIFLESDMRWFLPAYGGIQLTLNTVNRWTGFVSLLNPTNIVSKIQEASFVESFHGIPLMANSDEVQPEAQASPSFPGNGPEPLQRNLEALLFEETGKVIQSFETMISSTVALGMVLREVFESATSNNVPSSSAPFTPLLKQIAKLIAIARDDFRAKFPLPATAPGHATRVRRVSEALEHLQQLLVRLARDYEIEQEVIERHLARVKPLLHDVGVLIGDVAELYPGAIEALVLNISTALLPEAVFLRSLVILYCSGPYVLGKDAISGWLLRHLWDFESLSNMNRVRSFRWQFRTTIPLRVPV